MEYSYKYPRPALTVDCVIFAVDFDQFSLKVLLIKRGLQPFADCWALPGGFVHMDETLEEAASRELKEETGLESLFLEQLYTFGNPERDPRERIVSVAYYALTNMQGSVLKADTDASDAAWFCMDDLPKLAFDHSSILAAARDRLQGKVRYQPVGFELLPSKFTLSELQRLYEILLERDFDKRNFRNKLQRLDILEDTEEVQKDVKHRAARLYRFNRQRYRDKKKQGVYFEI